MAKRNITEQFDLCLKNIDKYVDQVIDQNIIRFAIHVVEDVLPSQQGFRNLTGNTTTSYAFGYYKEGVLKMIGFNKDSAPALRSKLLKGDILTDFTDYDGNTRRHFVANVDTDGKFGQQTSIEFLNGYKATGKYSLIFTTGTEYSAYLENVRDLNVLSDGFNYVASHFVKSFKPIR